MRNFEIAKHIQKMMGFGNIYYDKLYMCWRLMRPNSPSLIKYSSHYDFIR